MLPTMPYRESDCAMTRLGIVLGIIAAADVASISLRRLSKIVCLCVVDFIIIFFDLSLIAFGSVRPEIFSIVPAQYSE